MKHYKIAVIDDDELFLTAICGALAPKHDVYCMSSTAELVDFLQNTDQQVDGFFVDLNMPDVEDVSWQLGGLSAIRYIRQHFGDEVPMIGVLSGMDPQVHSYTCLKNGADAFIEKSTEVSKIADDVQERLLKRVA